MAATVYQWEKDVDLAITIDERLACVVKALREQHNEKVIDLVNALCHALAEEQGVSLRGIKYQPH